MKLKKSSFVQTTNPLVSALLKRTDSFSPLQRRHLSFISQFVDSIQYRQGQENIVADTLSRLMESESDLQELGVFKCEPDDQLPHPEAFFKAQQQDEQLQAWIVKHQNCDSPFIPNLVQCAELPKQKIWADCSTSPPKILVPSCYQRAVFNHFHNVAHFGYKACFALINKTHYWPNFKRDIQIWSRECPSCQKNKIARHTSSYLSRLPIPSKRFSHIHVDLIGPFNRQDDNTSLFTIIDRWSGWPEAIPVPDKCSAKNLAKILINCWISRFGIPNIITSDLGKQFVSKLWIELNDILGIKQTYTTPYHPQSNGKVERLHRTMKNSLRCRLNGKSDWIQSSALGIAWLEMRSQL